MSVLTFSDLAWEVMRQRKKDGIRGLDREWSRFRCHISSAPFATKEGQQGKPLGKSSTFKSYLALVGITRRVRWHDLRHTCATNLVTGALGRKWALTEVQRVMGHSSVTITERYSHVGDDVIAQAARETTTVRQAPQPVESVLLKDAYRALAKTAKRAVWTVIEHMKKEARRVA